MKIRKMIGLALAFVGLPLTTYGSNQMAVLTPANIGYISINTTTNSDGGHNIAVITTSAPTLQSPCNGVWLNTSTDQATYAMFLTAVTTQKKITIYYDPSQPSPWGNPAWCALTLAWITP